MGVAHIKSGGRLKSVVTRHAGSGIILGEFKVEGVASPQLQRTIGLGDLVATFAQPVAMLIDGITERLLSPEHKTALAKCSACARRHTKGNLLCPDILTCPVLGRLLGLLPDAARSAVLDAVAKHAKPLPPTNRGPVI